MRRKPCSADFGDELHEKQIKRSTFKHLFCSEIPCMHKRTMRFHGTSRFIGLACVRLFLFVFHDTNTPANFSIADLESEIRVFANGIHLLMACNKQKRT